MPYARNTKVPVDRSRNEIETLLARYGAGKFGYLQEDGRAVIMFEAADRRLRFDLPLPVGIKDRDAQECRRRWRALVLSIKAKLESVHSGIETFEEAFLAHVVMPDGRTVADHARLGIAAAYTSGVMQPLLPPPSQGDAGC